MSILGKLLIVFNLLAAGAFVYFVVQDWKVRQDVTWNALSREVQLRGIALEPETPPPTADELEGDRVAFPFAMPGNLTYRTIPKARRDAMIPGGRHVPRRRGRLESDGRSQAPANESLHHYPRPRPAAIRLAADLPDQPGPDRGRARRRRRSVRPA